MDQVPGTEPISKAPYGMTAPELCELRVSSGQVCLPPIIIEASTYP